MKWKMGNLRQSLLIILRHVKRKTRWELKSDCRGSREGGERNLTQAAKKIHRTERSHTREGGACDPTGSG